MQRKIFSRGPTLARLLLRSVDDVRNLHNFDLEEITFTRDIVTFTTNGMSLALYLSGTLTSVPTCHWIWMEATPFLVNELMHKLELIHFVSSFSHCITC